jgi:hypothetical protein
MVVVFGFKSGCSLVWFLCSHLFLAGMDYNTCCKVLRLLSVHIIYGVCIGYIVFIVLGDMAHAARLDLLACKEHH